tara:strand:+ start:640 stop:843 length:204 start_codon:yes stop_codon:yes gene_type:complete
VKQFLKYLILITLFTGCANLKEVDISLTGIEMEYYPAHPSQEEPSIFGGALPKVGDTLPELMPMTKK